MCKPLIAVLILFMAPAAFGQISSKKKRAADENQPKFYGTVEVRHHLNTFFEEDGYRGRQEPSTHVRLQAGAQLYEKRVDVYATLGVFKEPMTQQIKQRRPEVALDLYPFRNKYYSVLQYNIVQVPFEEREQDPDAEVTSSDAGSIYTFGLAPTIKYPFMALDSQWKVKMGLDGWTKMYTRKQYTGQYEDGEYPDRGFGLSQEEAKDGQVEAEPIEDIANHYELLSLFGLQVKPSYLPGLTAEATLNYSRKFDPDYTRLDNGNVDYRYGVESRSYYRARAKYKISERLTLINDFYHFHGGLFESKKDGENRRFRNIARISCRL